MEQNQYYELSHSQKRIWYSELMYPNTSLANLAGSVVFHDETIDFELLKRAINTVIRSCDALRLRFLEATEWDNDLRQYISEGVKRDFEIIEDQNLMSWMLNQSKVQFSLIDSDLFYFALFKSTENKCGYYFRYHHIICDAMSVALLNKQIVMTYRSLINNGKAPYKLDAPSFTEFLDREKHYLESDQYNEDKAFWHNEFEGMPESSTLNLYTDNKNIKTERMVFSLGERLSEQIHHFCEQNSTTLFRFFMSIFTVYFLRTTGNNDLVIGTGHHNRLNKRERELVGMTVSTLPIRICVDAHMDFLTLLKVVTEKISSCLSHHCYPFDLLTSDLREKGYDPSSLLNIMLNHIPSSSDEYTVERYTPGCDPSVLNIKINPNQLAKEAVIEIGVDYRIEVFEEKAIKRLFEQVEVLIKDVIVNPLKRLYELEIIPSKEKALILNQFSHVLETNDEYQCMHQLFSQQALRTPNRVAIVCKGKNYTYAQLNKKTDQLAVKLRARGVLPEARVAIMTERSEDFVIGVLAIMKAGGAYLPIDPNSPQDRMDFMLSDSGVELILSHKALKGKATYFKGEWLELEDQNLYVGDCSDVNNVNKPTDLAYIIYTSGSSGTPKGVMVEHRNVFNFCRWYNDFYQLSESDICTAYCNFTFDVSIAEILPPLMVGAAVHIISEEIRLSPDEINGYFVKEAVTVATFPTRMGEILMETFVSRSLRVLTLVGEKLNKYKRCNYKLINAYGPTETTIYASVATIEGDSNNLPIGKPLTNTWAYVVDDYGNLVPIGTKGELWLAGAQVARGYLNQLELTREQFIQNPFSMGEKNNVVYKTGDLVQWLSDGNLVYSGRKDDQVKIRGFRVELSEVEATLLQLPEIEAAVVLEDNNLEGNTYLQAFVVVNGQVDSEEVKRKISTKLPEYMIPHQITQVPNILINQNGKVDRKAFHKMLDNLRLDIRCDHVQPATITEQKVLNLWKKLLPLDQISTTKSFFELGGNSLLAIRLFLMIKEVFKLNLPVSIIFRENTIQKLSHVIDDEKTDETALVCIKQGKGRKPLFLIHDFSGEILAYSLLAAAIEGDDPIYGLRYSEKLHMKVGNLEALAASYIQEIQAIQPRGGYRLVGSSSGGIIAYEMGRQLLERKEKVDLLTLLDTPNYYAYPVVINNVFFATFRYAFNWLGLLSYKDKYAFIVASIRDLLRGTNAFKAQKSLRLLLAKYVPKAYPNMLILFRANKRMISMDEKLGWGHLAREIEVYEIKGNHVSVINKENSKVIAEIIEKILLEDEVYERAHSTTQPK